VRSALTDIVSKAGRGLIALNGHLAATDTSTQAVPLTGD
jgi:hypothetical protein